MSNTVLSLDSGRKNGVHYRLRNLKRSLTYAVAVSALMCGSAYAQNTDTGEEDTRIEDTIIVVGTAGGQGISRQDAAFAVTTIGVDDINEIAPASTADLLKNIPGVWAESSGGTAAGNNIDVRGLPGGGDAPFVTQSINGSPVFGFTILSFFDQSAIIRVDETIEAVEGVRGGPGSVFGRGEPGLTVNYRIREGGDDHEARIKFTTGLNFNENRVDAVASGPLGNDTYYSIGGYVRGGSGVRDTEFNIEEGYQLTAQLTKHLDRGKVNVYGRVLDDSGQWVLPFNTENPAIDAGTFAQQGNANRFRTINFGPGGDSGPDGDIPAATQQTFDFSDGRGFDGVIFGGNFEYDLGGNFTVRNNLNYVNGDNNTLGLVPSGGAVLVSDVLASQEAIDAGITELVVQESGAAAPRTLAGDSFIQTYGFWVVQKELEHFSNDFSINYQGQGHDFTVGYYLSAFGSDDVWSIGNPAVLENVANGGFVLGQDGTELDPGLVNGGFNFNVQQSGDATVNAGYIADTWQVTDALRIDAAGRIENIAIDYTGDFGGTLDGVFEQVASVSETQFAYTVGVNYDFADNLGAFGRWSDGHRFPDFDAIRQGQFNVFDVTQAEIGLKFTSDALDLYATGYLARNDSFNNVVGADADIASVFTSRALGVELEGDLRLGAGFRTKLIATLQDTEITDSSTATEIDNRVLRQPNIQILVRPSYNFDLGDFSGAVFGSAQFVGNRFGDNANTNQLDSFVEVSIGGSLRHRSGVFAQLSVDNLTDSDGFTEADPRTPSANNARPIFGRAIRLSIGADF